MNRWAPPERFDRSRLIKCEHQIAERRSAQQRAQRSNSQLHHLDGYVLRTVIAAFLAMLVERCAQQPAMPKQPTSETSWTLATSIMQWNDFACVLIARNRVEQFPALRVLLYLTLEIH